MNYHVGRGEIRGSKLMITLSIYQSFSSILPGIYETYLTMIVYNKVKIQADHDFLIS